MSTFNDEWWQKGANRPDLWLHAESVMAKNPDFVQYYNAFPVEALTPEDARFYRRFVAGIGAIVCGAIAAAPLVNALHDIARGY
jgi:hypothetical protein